MYPFLRTPTTHLSCRTRSNKYHQGDWFCPFYTMYQSFEDKNKKEEDSRRSLMIGCKKRLSLNPYTVSLCAICIPYRFTLKGRVQSKEERIYFIFYQRGGVQTVSIYNKILIYCAKCPNSSRKAIQYFSYYVGDHPNLGSWWVQPILNLIVRKKYKSFGPIAHIGKLTMFVYCLFLSV